MDSETTMMMADYPNGCVGRLEEWQRDYPDEWGTLNLVEVGWDTAMQLWIRIHQMDY